jgi:hypothetical protein
VSNKHSWQSEFLDTFLAPKQDNRGVVATIMMSYPGFGGVSLDMQVLASFISFLSCSLTEVRENGGLVGPKEGETPAHQLHYLISPTVGTEEKCCSAPSMSLKQPTHKVTEVSSKPSLEQAAALNLATPLEASRGELCSLPSKVLRNIADSFMSLVDSRIRSYLAALIQQSNKDPSRNLNFIVAFLSATSGSLIRPTAIVSSFRVQEDPSVSPGSSNVAPILQETTMDLNVLGQLMTVKFSGTGNAIAVFDDGAQFIVRVAVMLETVTILRSMMTQAREAVRKAVEIMSQLFLTSMSGPDKPANANTLLTDDTGATAYTVCLHEGVARWLQHEEQGASKGLAPQENRSFGSPGMLHSGQRETNLSNSPESNQFGVLGSQKTKLEDNGA